MELEVVDIIDFYLPDKEIDSNKRNSVKELKLLYKVLLNNYNFLIVQQAKLNPQIEDIFEIYGIDSK